MKADCSKILIIAISLLFVSCASSRKTDLVKAEIEQSPVSTTINGDSYKGNSYYCFTEAQLQIRRDNLDEAIRLLNLAIEDDPESLILKRELSIIYLHQKNIDEGLKVVQEILEKVPNDIEALIMYAGIKQNQKQNNEAKKAYEKVIKNDPSRENIYLILGSFYRTEGDLENALRVYGALVQNIPDSYAGHFFLGSIYADQGKTDIAEKKYKKTLELNNKLIEPRYSLIKLYKKKGHIKKIISIFIK